MIYPEYDNLESWGSKYALVALAAKRAKQIKSGAPALVDTQSRNPLTVALEEIAAGKITCVVSENDLPLPTAVEPEVAELLAIPLESDLDDQAPSLDEGSAVRADGEHDEIDGDHDEEEDSEELEDEDGWHELLDEDSGEVVVVEASSAAHEEEESSLGASEAVDVVAEADAKPKRRRGRPPGSGKTKKDAPPEASTEPEAVEKQDEEGAADQG